MGWLGFRGHLVVALLSQHAVCGVTACYCCLGPGLKQTTHTAGEERNEQKLETRAGTPSPVADTQHQPSAPHKYTGVNTQTHAGKQTQSEMDTFPPVRATQLSHKHMHTPTHSPVGDNPLYTQKIW